MLNLRISNPEILALRRRSVASSRLYVAICDVALTHFPAADMAEPLATLGIRGGTPHGIFLARSVCARLLAGEMAAS